MFTVKNTIFLTLMTHFSFNDFPLLIINKKIFWSLLVDLLYLLCQGWSATMRRKVTFNHHWNNCMRKSALSKACFFGVNFLNGLHYAFVIQFRICRFSKEMQVSMLMCPKYFLFINKFSQKGIIQNFPYYFFQLGHFLFRVFLSWCDYDAWQELTPLPKLKVCWN